MKLTYLLWILSFILLCPIFCSAQNELADSMHNKIGFGGWYHNTGEYYLIGSYSKILKRENEICLSFYYNKIGRAQEIILGGAFYYSIFKKPTKFDFLLASEINFNRYWFNGSYINKTVSRYRPFFYLGIIPSYNFSKRFSLSMECKIGEGYQWSKNYEYIYNDRVYYYHDYGWYMKVIGGFKLNYKF